MTQTQTKHTPGPWRADGFSVYHRGGGDVPRKPLAQVDSAYMSDCATDPARAMDSEIPEHEAYANARLIAAAPDLRSAMNPTLLDHAAELLADDGHPEYAAMLANKAMEERAAIAKATN